MAATDPLASRLHAAISAGEEFVWSKVATDGAPKPSLMGVAFEEVTPGSPRKSTRYCISPQMGLALGVSIGFETVVATTLTAGGSVLAQYKHPTSLPHQLLEPNDVRRRLGQVVEGVLSLSAKRWSSLTGRDVTAAGMPFVGACVAMPFWSDPSGRLVGTRYDYDWAEGGADGRGLLATKMLDQALAPYAIVTARTNAQPATAAANMFACEALASAYSRSPERDPDSPLARKDENWRTVFLIHAGCGLGAATVRYPANPIASTSGIDQFSFLHARLQGGASGSAGAIGHLPVQGLRAHAPCSCGTQSSVHLEQVAGGYARAAELLERLSDRARNEWGTKQIALMLELGAREDGFFNQAARESGRIIGCSIGSAVTLLDPAAIVTSGFLANATFNTALEEAVGEAGPRPSSQLEVLATRPQDTMFLASRGAALFVMRNRAWRRWEGFHALGQPKPLRPGQQTTPTAHLQSEALWLQTVPS